MRKNYYCLHILLFSFVSQLAALPVGTYRNAEYIIPGFSDINHHIAKRLVFTEPDTFYVSTEISTADIYPDSESEAFAAPTAICQNATVVLDAAGNGSITTADIDNGSFDPEGDPLNLSLDQTTFTCADVGVNTVTLTVLDTAESLSDSCTATVTVVDSVAPTAI
ncbi:MAG: hypothetical protein KJO25_00475, partial [Bacteroidia bacterium]|nr:hypothetical protein [Bacteroidia bacterium]